MLGNEEKVNIFFNTFKFLQNHFIFTRLKFTEELLKEDSNSPSGLDVESTENDESQGDELTQAVESDPVKPAPAPESVVSEPMTVDEVAPEPVETVTLAPKV